MFQQMKLSNAPFLEIINQGLLYVLISICVQISADFEKALDSSETSSNKTSPITTTNPILHVTKGKYFRNHSLSSDIETDGPSFSCALGQWFWKDGTGKWNPYCRETNAKINRCYKRDPKSTAIVTVQNQT